MNTNDFGRRHNKASNGILASKCQLTAVFVGERRQITINSLYRFPQNPERLAVWEEKLSAVKILYRLVLCCFTYVLFLDQKIPNNVTERSDQNYEEKPYFGP